MRRFLFQVPARTVRYRASQPQPYTCCIAMAKRKRSSAAGADSLGSAGVVPQSKTPIPLPSSTSTPRPSLPHRSSRNGPLSSTVNPDINAEIIDAPNALRASPDGSVNSHIEVDSNLSDFSEPPEDIVIPGLNKRKRATKPKAVPETVPRVKEETESKVKKEPVVHNTDPENDDMEEANEEELQEALGRPPPVNSSVLPLPWKGRLGFACLNTYLRYSNPPVFCSRTCRIASILEHRHPLADPSQPEHATKNRPNKDLPADIGRGQRYVEEIGLANARDIVKMIRWNHRYGIRFMRLSSEMFPFASHDVYGYKLAPFASEVLAEAGKVIGQLGHRVTMHPGQFTQLGSPRKSVIENSFRDLEYHDELLTLLKLPPKQDKDAVLILHMGGVFGDKAATLDRFRENYAKLSQSIKNRLVLENDDVSWSVHDLLPICQELNIPLVLDFHHHNIIFDETKLREGTHDIIWLYPAIEETWKRKGITQKMHYSEQTPAAITKRQRRKHSPRVATLPPCSPIMDLMIEAKDKEQAVFELMRTFKLPGFNTFSDMIPHVRKDDNKPVRVAKKKTPKKRKGKAAEEEPEEEDVVTDEAASTTGPIPEDEVGMGGPDGRVYWPPGMEEWLRPKKREIKKKDPANPTGTPAKLTPAQKRKEAAAAAVAAAAEVAEDVHMDEESSVVTPVKGKKVAVKKETKPRKRAAKAAPTPSPSDEEDEVVSEPPSDLSAEESEKPIAKRPKAAPRRKSGRAGKTVVNYAEDDE